MKSAFFYFLLLVLASSPVRAQESESSRQKIGPATCGDMEFWDYSMSMCMPLAMAGMPMKMIMLHGNAFAVETIEEKPRGRDALTGPDMLMLDLGQSVGDHQYINLDIMGTLEKWTFPNSGAPELLQIGEEDENNNPFIDAQHPHSSPLMGLTLSDTIGWGRDKDHVKIFFAPRGESTDGPIAFMHRPTGMVNPMVPLGHHVGQDVGHISSTVLGASLGLGSTTLEYSSFHGAEPEPTKIDLPMGPLDSSAMRLIEQITPQVFAMASAAYVKNPEPSQPLLDHLWRYSASLYSEHELGSGWLAHNALIYGLINNYDEVSVLNSFDEEFVLQKNALSWWGRLEVLQRSAGELEIPQTTDANKAQWVTALTLGVTRHLWSFAGQDISLGGSLSKDFLPAEFRSSYAGDPLSGNVFLQWTNFNMWIF